METTETVQAIVASVFPEDCALIGQTNFEQLLKARDDVQRTRIPGKHNISIEASLEIVTATIAVVRQMLLLYRDLVREFGKPPTAEQLTRKFESLVKKLPTDVINKLLDLARLVIAQEKTEDDAGS